MNNKGFTLIEILITLLGLGTAVIGGYGWIMNIVKIYHSSFTPLTADVVLRVVGIFLAPLGMVMGYL